MSFAFRRLHAFLLVSAILLLPALLTGCQSDGVGGGQAAGGTAARPGLTVEQRAQQARRPSTQWNYIPLYPSDRTPRLTSLGDFDTPRNYLGRAWRHRGLDIADQPGAAVIAVSPGRACALEEEVNGLTVLFFPRLPLEGGGPAGDLLVREGRNGEGDAHKVWIRYAHLRGTAPLLKPCAEVAMGEVLGYIGRSGIASQPHLHFEVLLRDPAAYPGDPALGGALNPFALMRLEPGQVPGTIACFEPGMAWRPNEGQPVDELTIVWPTQTC